MSPSWPDLASMAPAWYVTRLVSGFRTITEYLSWDHARLDAALDEVCALMERGELATARQRFAKFHALMMRHIRLEEGLLMPVVEGKAGLRIASMEDSRREHKRIIEAIVSMKSALQADGGAPFLEARLKFAALLPAHHAQEEKTIYPVIDGAMSDEERHSLVEHLEHAP